MRPAISFAPTVAIAMLLFVVPATAAPPIARQTFIATMDTQYAKLDSNHDGIVSQAEVEANQRDIVRQAATRRAQLEFGALDGDHNGQISNAEWLKARVQTVPAVNGGAIMRRLDRNGDGKVTLVEYRALTLANFDRLDTDLDGFVSEAEQRADTKTR